MTRRNKASANGTAATEAPAAPPATEGGKPPAQPAPVTDAPAADTDPAPAPAANDTKSSPAADPAPPTGDEIIERSYNAIVDEPGDFAPVTAAIRQLSPRELRVLLTLLETPHAEARFKAQDPTFRSYRKALHAIAAQLAVELDARYGIRREVGQKEGHGAYIEAGPLGTIGLGIGHVYRRKLTNGTTKARHTGAGFYIRTGSLAKVEVSSGNRLHQLAKLAKEMGAAKASDDSKATAAA